MSSLYPDQQLKRRAMTWALRLKVNPERVEIAHMPLKWGSCTSEGVVTFAEELAKADEAFQDYVIVHELLHLRYPRHDRRFKAVLGAHVPNWRSIDQVGDFDCGGSRRGTGR